MTEFVFANFFKIIKKYTNKKYSNLELMYFLFSKVNKDNDDAKTELRINKSQVSRILNRVDDIPKRVRNYYCDLKNESDLNCLFDDFVYERLEDEKDEILSTELTKFFKDDPRLHPDVKKHLSDSSEENLSIFLSEIFKEVLKIDNRTITSPISIYLNGNTSLNLLIDDLLKIGFNNKYILNKKIVVIPVNTTFDMQITNPEDCIQHVSEFTLHGKWILKMEEKGINYQRLVKLIKTSTKSNNQLNNSEFQIGSIIVVKYKNTYFYLLAVSIFDERGKAYCDLEKLNKALDSLIAYYNNNGQGYPIYIPLIGTGMTRLNLSHLDSFNLIREKVISKIDKISGSINIVGFTKDKEKLRGIVDGL